MARHSLMDRTVMSRRPARAAPVLVLLLALAGCEARLSLAGDVPGEEALAIPVTDASGAQVVLRGRLCRPTAGSGPARLVVIAHGSPINAAARPGMQLGRCDSEAARWFTARGYAVALALRRGYGATGGAWAEGYGSCGQAHYELAGRETARDIAAVVDYATSLPGIRPDGAVIVGQSAGGWGTIAYDAEPHPKVEALVVMAGGRGGHEGGVPGQNCRPERLAEAAGRYGAAATTPMLWIYAANDSYFAPLIVTAMHRAFTEAGGRAELAQLGPYGRDGHRLFFGPDGSRMWGPVVERYLVEQGAGPG